MITAFRIFDDVLIEVFSDHIFDAAIAMAFDRERTLSLPRSYGNQESVSRSLFSFRSQLHKRPANAIEKLVSTVS